MLERLVAAGGHKQIVGIDIDRGEATGVTWRLADVRDPALRAAWPASTPSYIWPPTAIRTRRRPTGARSTSAAPTSLLTAAAAAGVRRLVLLTSAMVYGADAATTRCRCRTTRRLRADPDLTPRRRLGGDGAARRPRAARAYPSLRGGRVRPGVAGRAGAATRCCPGCSRRLGCW